MVRLLAATLLLVSITASRADIITNDLASFVSQTGPNSIATFDDVAAGTPVPFTSGGATFTDPLTGGQVLDSLVSLGHDFWFGSAGSSPNFFGVTFGPDVAFPSEVNAFGMLMACFGCDLLPNDALISWTLYSAQGDVVGAGSEAIDFTPSSEGNPRFLGVISSVPFTSLSISKTNLSDGQPGGTYIIDDFRYASSASSVPEPASLLLLTGALVGLRFIRRRRAASN